jgi:energy-coupling factor transporter ATP-binding protein EcfA2
MRNRDFVVICWSIVIIYLIVALTFIWWIFSHKPLNQEAAVAAIFILSPVGMLLFEPIRERLEESIDDLITSATIDKSIYRILIFGRHGSGKTTFIDTAFTYIDPADPRRKSTEYFEYRRFQVVLHRKELQLGQYTHVEVADYKGQEPSQVIINSSKDFFGPKHNRVLNAIIFIVDLVPRKTDEHGNPLNDDSLLEWLKNGNMLDKIKERVEEHNQYINEVSLHLLFSSLYSHNLKSVIFVINKKDLIEKLMKYGYLTTNFSDFREYARHLFAPMIKNINKACTQLGIEDFSNNDSWVFTVSARSSDELKPLIVRLLRTRS